MTIRFYAGFFVLCISVVVTAFDGSRLTKFVTRFLFVFKITFARGYKMSAFYEQKQFLLNALCSTKVEYLLYLCGIKSAPIFFETTDLVSSKKFWVGFDFVEKWPSAQQKRFLRKSYFSCNPGWYVKLGYIYIYLNFNGSNIRFTEDVFRCMISAIFIAESLHFVIIVSAFFMLRILTTWFG